MGNAHQKPSAESASAAHLGVTQKLDRPARPLIAIALASIPKKQLVEIVGGRINERSIRRWRSGKHPPPNWVVTAVAEHLEKEAATRAAFAETLRNAPPRTQFVPTGPKPKNLRTGPIDPAPLAKG